MAGRRPLVLLAIAFALLVVLWASETLLEPQTSPNAIGVTECRWLGGPRVRITAAAAPNDTMPARVHEAVHASQCRALGTLRYRWSNLTASGRLSLEAPAYCAAARARLARGDDGRLVRERLHDDVFEAFRAVVDSARVDHALRRSCPELVSGAPRGRQAGTVLTVFFSDESDWADSTWAYPRNSPRRVP